MVAMSINFIVTAKHYGKGSAREYIRKTQADLYKRGVVVQIERLDGEPSGVPVHARIWQGQWVADCECCGASFVDPDEPVFFCFSCGNRSNGKQARPVIFPAERAEIERLILERPVNDMAGLSDLERAGMAKPILFVGGRALTRSWMPGETVQDLHDQQDEVIGMWRRANGIQ
jgi:hypothetical protein